MLAVFSVNRKFIAKRSLGCGVFRCMCSSKWQGIVQSISSLVGIPVCAPKVHDRDCDVGDFNQCSILHVLWYSPAFAIHGRHSEVVSNVPSWQIP